MDPGLVTCQTNRPNRHFVANNISGSKRASTSLMFYA